MRDTAVRRGMPSVGRLVDAVLPAEIAPRHRVRGNLTGGRELTTTQVVVDDADAQGHASARKFGAVAVVGSCLPLPRGRSSV